jgi:hypothetical protein
MSDNRLALLQMANDLAEAGMRVPDEQLKRLVNDALEEVLQAPAPAWAKHLASFQVAELLRPKLDEAPAAPDEDAEDAEGDDDDRPSPVRR